MRQHGKVKRRTWRKIHLSVCPDSHEIILSELTLSNKADDLVASQMISKLPKSVKTTYGDRAYDRQAYYQSSYIQGINPLVPPRRGGRLSQETDKPWMKKRNDALKIIQGFRGDEGLGNSGRSSAAIIEDRLPKRRCTALKEALEEIFALGNYPISEQNYMLNL
ncbi:hypothetical protein NCS13_1_0758 [Neochlamydia sp. S13]|nr:hypothetical protein NCS13_1_0758 [Neochlamydia sp. S13]